MTSCSDLARPVALGELEQLAPPPAQDPVSAARAVIATAEAQAGALREQAVQDGFAEGVRLGREEAALALAPAADALRAALEEARAIRDAMVDAGEARAVELALAIAERVVAAAIDVEPQRVVDVVRGALRGVLDGERIVVCVHPDDVELVRAAGLQRDDAHIEIHAERRVPRGGALVRTSVGEIDGRIECKLAAVHALVSAELAGS